mmetsp:Transcript_45207/g.109410  ORF Transcript_45207/g.109410 Transcript_45207/m.109410 type:complete len:943 (-) Transcript_45207:54-2882(-)|eukprot:CAMPEP_0113610912 /NCGR_PEP_ID=MMETSP0017_2-20120614/5278_1 /TAXON_ID=2856 /ORGANISM="Cylindrotheca closterium" /LENGTH=942 /DNA_ID=CAMNT_0000519829 /DNA_START=170 /DNA_END=2998 /DNA_ORIENTATION=+ /assembly_acc=CAM_ASM_000147
MSTVNQADESGGKPADTGNSGNNLFSATNNDANSSFALLQQVQSILLENNDAKARMVDLENQVATFQKEREELNHQLEENQKTSEQTIQRLQQQLSLKEEEWTKRYETTEANHKSDLQRLQSKLDDWESQHQDWNVQQEKYQGDISELEEGKVQLESQVQQLESNLEESKVEASRLRQNQEEASKAHQEEVGEINSQLETLQNDLEAHRLQQKEEQQSHEEQERNLNEAIQELTDSVKEKDESLQSLNEEIKELRTEASQLKQDHQAQVEDMEATIANLEQENVAQSTQAEDYQTEIEKLQEEMDSLKSVFLEQQKQAEEKEKETKQQDQEEQEVQESQWQDVVQSLRIQVQAQTNIAETQSRELEDAKSQNMQLRVQLQVSSQQKEQLERNWNETKEQLKSLEGRLSGQNNGGDSSNATATETQQDQETTNLMEENRRLNDRIVQMEAQLVLGGSRSLDHSERSKEDGLGNNGSQGNNTNDTIAQLQQRIMHLVEEKLILQTAVETLEHQFVESDLLERNAVSRKLQQNNKPTPATAMKEYWHNRQLQLQQQQEPPTIVVDENTKQADIIRQTMEHRQSQKITRRISKKVLGTKPKAPQQIDVKATKELFLQEQQKQEQLKKTRTETRTNLSNARSTTTEIGRSSWVRSRDHGLDASHDNTTSTNNNGSKELPDYLGSKQHGFIQSAVRSSSSTSSNNNNKKEKTTTWTRIRDSIAGPNKTDKAEGEAQPSDVDDFSLWVQELSQEQQDAEAKEYEQLGELESLSVPASMLDPLPTASSNTARYAVQLLDDILKEGADGGAEVLTKKLGKREEQTHAADQQTYQVAAPAQTEPTRVSTEEENNNNKTSTTIVGRGKAIDQSNLLGVYVNKRKEAANSTTIGYLSSMIYGDPDEEEAKIQQKLLKRQLARKKKQEQLEREKLKKAVQDTIKTKPKTIFSSFV